MATARDSDEDVDYDTDESGTQPPSNKKFKPAYKQRFRVAWLELPHFKSWLKASQGGSKPTCSVCSTTVPCSKSGIERHSKSAGHATKIKTMKSQRSVSDCFVSKQQSTSYKMLTEGRICSFIAENNLPFSLSKPLLDLTKAICPSSPMETEMLQQLKLGATKCTNIIRQGLGYNFSKSLVETLKTTMFSIIPDETTDVSCEKQLALCVVYFDYEKLEVVTSFFDMVVVEKSDAESLYAAIKKCFEDKNIPLKNIVGFASDTCNVMFGEKHSVASRMKAEFPHISFIKCSCHMIHLCMSHACLKLSTRLEDLCRNIFSHFSRSSLRQHELKEFQMFLNLSPHKMLAFGQTRWLSLEACVSRILEQWDALILYFTSVISECRDPSYVTDSVLGSLKNPFIKAQLQFVQVQLHRVNDFNTLFQSTSPKLQYLHDEVEKLLQELMGDFIQRNILRNCDPFSLDVQNTNFHVPLKEVYVGIHATDTLLNSPVCKDTESMKKYKLSCKEFLIELINQIRSRFQTQSLKVLSFLHPENALNLRPSSLREVFQSFPFMKEMCDCDQADLERRKLGVDTQRECSTNQDIVEFWKEHLSRKKINGQPKYPNLMKIIGSTLTLPHSNAAVERIFSQVGLIKTDLRNSLKPCSLVSLLHFKKWT